MNSIGEVVLERQSDQGRLMYRNGWLCSRASQRSWSIVFVIYSDDLPEGFNNLPFYYVLLLYSFSEASDVGVDLQIAAQ